MIKLQKLHPLLAFFLFALCSSCLNQYEKDVIGYYKVKEYKLTDSTTIINFNMPTLTVNSDKTFVLSVDGKELGGKWDADDYGDWTLANFYLKGNKVQSHVGIETLKILQPHQFQCPYFKTMVFEKIKDNKGAKYNK